MAWLDLLPAWGRTWNPEKVAQVSDCLEVSGCVLFVLSFDI